MQPALTNMHMIDAIVGTFFTPDGPTVNPQYQPPQRTWVGLTDDEICKLEGFYDFMTKEEFFDAIRKVETKLKEKNGN